MFEDKQFESVVSNKAAIQNTSRAILADPKQREEFLADPAAYMKKAGIPFSGQISLSERDRDIIKLVSDPGIATLYNSGNIAQLTSYLRGNYPNLINDPIRSAWTVADFEVAIEAVAIAVGVFIAPIRPQDDFSELSRVESVQSARMAALEARVAQLEAQAQAAS
jgi:hypothetical protein